MRSCLVVPLALGVLVACTPQQVEAPRADTTPETSAPPPDGTGAGEDGAALYATYCGFCHGANGEGYLADNANALSNQHFLSSVTDGFLRDAIVHGRPGTPMSAWGSRKSGPLQDPQVEAIIAHIRGWQTTPNVEIHDRVVSGVALRGEPIYNALCATCHGADGSGVTAVSLNNPWMHESASDGFLRYAISDGRPGTPMPAYAGQLNDRQMDDLVAYLRTWRTPVDATPAPPYVPDISNAVQNPQGSEPSFTVREDRFVPADEVHAALQAGQRLLVMDARPVADYQTSHITGALGLPFYDLARYLDQLPRDVWIITYCGCPHAVSGQALDALREAGFPRVSILDEGFYVWEERGYPVSRAIAQP